MKVFLEMDRGPQAGQRFELGLNVYRAIGRVDGFEGNQTMILGEDRPLDPEERARVERHLAARKSRGEPKAERSPDGLRRGADILVEDGLTSRTHAMVFLDEDGPSLVDLGSTNGTKVNGATVTDAELFDGDLVHIGGVRFVVRVG